ncbi:hypothetical protein BGZ80_010741 [Entomortierella chlamydospora]|uniref:Uncharacterized protein n=1 Tax=Entomortierella chlamydospora TaxID=101097 RepID=A0A9P6SZJ1_9FUNG|nr:hypothetical protein BGZ79_001200 [Entomortierella chlamydospora]KAG0013975.1 hypothetical protein BGZ80_010741 [Entomortierella chlamydospora]
MSLFKFNGASSSSKKNKTVSTSSTPRTSIQLSSADIPVYEETLVTAEVAFERLAKKGVPLSHFYAMVISRI